MAGPFCCMLLGDMGADVIKVEPPEGETTRQMDLALAPGLGAVPGGEPIAWSTTRAF